MADVENRGSDEASAFWEERYRSGPQIWSGKVNHALSVTVASTLKDASVGAALDLGCGEGADAIWLARRGWRVTGIDLSPTAIERARAEAERLGFDIDLQCADLEAWRPASTYALVSACFLHSPVALARTEILRTAAQAVAPGGHLLVVGHATPPPWSDHAHHSHSTSGSAEEEVRRLALDPAQWEILVAEDRARGVHDPEGAPAVLEDAVVLARRR